VNSNDAPVRECSRVHPEVRSTRLVRWGRLMHEAAEPGERGEPDEVESDAARCVFLELGVDADADGEPSPVRGDTRAPELRPLKKEHFASRVGVH
jgi:hypothetical protein